MADIAAAVQGSELIDLTVTLAEHLPAAWPTHMPFQRKVYNWYESRREGQIQPVHGFRGPYQTAWLALDEHCGTHFDAPTHFIPPPDSGLPLASDLGAQSGDKVPLEDLMGPAAVVDVGYLSGQGEPGVSPFIEPDHVSRFEQEHGELVGGEVVLFKTGWDRYYVEGEEGEKYLSASLVTERHPGWPAPSSETAVYLHEKGVKTIGIDAPSIGSAHDGVPVHQEGLGRGMRYVELLTNLSELPVRGALFVFLPVKIAGSSGGPGRAMALLPRGG